VTILFTQFVFAVNSLSDPHPFNVPAICLAKVHRWEGGYRWVRNSSFSLPIYCTKGHSWRSNPVPWAQEKGVDEGGAPSHSNILETILETGGWLTVSIFKGWIEAPNSLWVATSLIGGWGRGQDSDVASGKIFRISKSFQRSKEELFETLKMQKNLKTIIANTESTDLVFKAFKKFILVALSL